MEQSLPLPAITRNLNQDDNPVTALPVTSNDEFTRQLLEEIEREAVLQEKNQLQKPVDEDGAPPPPQSRTSQESIKQFLDAQSFTKKRNRRSQEQTDKALTESKFLNFLRDTLKDKSHHLEVALEDTNPYLPQELIAGSVPHIKGMEEDMVWNAAVQTCGTERVYFAYTVYDGRCWYLACPAAAMASNPDSWCPLISALPGNSEFLDKQTVYIYEEAGIAAALRWDVETNRLQVFSGPSRSVLPKIQSMDASFVTIDSELATRYPWVNKNLMQEHLARMTVSWLVKSAVLTTLLAMVYIVFLYFQILIYDSSLAAAQRDTETDARKLLEEATNALQGSSYTHIFRIQELLDELGKVGGALMRYQVDNKGVVIWQAVVPAATPSENLSKLSARSTGKKDDGRILIEGKR